MTSARWWEDRLNTEDDMSLEHCQAALKQHRAAIDFSIDMKVLRCCDYVIQRHPHEFEAGDLGLFSAGVRANTKMLKPAC